MLTWLLTVLHSWQTYVSRLRVSGGNDKMNLEGTQDSFNNNELRNDIDGELRTHTLSGALLSDDTKIRESGHNTTY